MINNTMNAATMRGPGIHKVPPRVRIGKNRVPSIKELIQIFYRKRNWKAIWEIFASERWGEDAIMKALKSVFPELPASLIFQFVHFADEATLEYLFAPIAVGIEAYVETIITCMIEGEDTFAIDNILEMLFYHDITMFHRAILDIMQADKIRKIEYKALFCTEGWDRWAGPVAPDAKPGGVLIEMNELVRIGRERSIVLKQEYWVLFFAHDSFSLNIFAEESFRGIFNPRDCVLLRCVPNPGLHDFPYLVDLIIRTHDTTNLQSVTFFIASQIFPSMIAHFRNWELRNTTDPIFPLNLSRVVRSIIKVIDFDKMTLNDYDDLVNHINQGYYIFSKSGAKAFELVSDILLPVKQKLSSSRRSRAPSPMV